MTRRNANGSDAPRNAGPAAVPRFWSQSAGLAGGTVLTYAVRGGVAYYALIAFGAALVLYCGSVIFRWLTEGELTAAGYVVLVLVPGGGLLFGLRCLDVALRARTDYTLTQHGLRFRDQSLFGGKSLDIPRASIVGVWQGYTPPGPSAASSSPGEWTTYLTWADGSTGKRTDFALTGMYTREEARWLGPLLADWAGRPLTRGFSNGYEEADPEELPKP